MRSAASRGAETCAQARIAAPSSGASCSRAGAVASNSPGVQRTRTRDASATRSIRHAGNARSTNSLAAQTPGADCTNSASARELRGRVRVGAGEALPARRQVAAQGCRAMPRGRRDDRGRSMAGSLIVAQAYQEPTKTKPRTGRGFAGFRMQAPQRLHHVAHVGHAAGPFSSFFGSSATITSVVSSRPATDEAFCSARRVTLVGSRMPISIRSPYSPVAAL
jgi:hypothetical protein